MRYIDLSSMNSDKGSNSITQVPTYYIKSQTLLPNKSYTLPIKCSPFNPSNAEATFVQSKRTQRVFENHLNPVMLVFIG